MPDLQEKQAIIMILRTATQKAAEFFVAENLVTRERFHTIITESTAEQKYELIVQQLTYLETPDEVPYVNIFVTNNGDVYRCNIFLYPTDGQDQKVTIRTEVNSEDWGTENRFR